MTPAQTGVIEESQKTVEWLARFCHLACWGIAAVGCSVLAGWVFHLEWLVRPLPSSVAMNPLTAFGFIIAALALELKSDPARILGWRRTLAAILTALVFLLGFWRVSEYLIGVETGLDRFLFKASWAGTDVSGTGIAPNTALCFVLAGCSLIVMDIKEEAGFQPAQALILTIGLVALLALLGYAYQVFWFYQIGSSIPMAFNSALCFCAWSVAALAARPRRGMMKIVISAGSGGAMARRLLPVAILIPCLLGALRLIGEHSGFFAAEFGVSLFAVATIIIFTAVIWWNARLLYLADLERTAAEQRLATQYLCTRILADSPGQADAIPRILETVCGIFQWPCATFWSLSPEPERLQHALHWHANAPALERYAHALQTTVYTRGTGFPGRAWAESRALCFSGVEFHRGCAEPGLARDAGLKSALDVPVCLGEESFGVLEFMQSSVDCPPARVVEVFEALGTQIAQFIERERAEHQLRQATHDLQRSNTDLQQFAYVASHDLFEPLRMVTSYLQLLMQRQGATLNAEGREFISFALDGARRMQALINGLLDYSRVEMRGRPFEPTDCEAVLKAALSNLEVAITETQAVISHDPLPRVRADSVQLTQVFQNLIGNAIKFHGPNPPRIHVSATPQGREQILSVKDAGIGIDPKFFERIFIIFQRLHTRREYSGTGIGLAVCKRIVERHGGRIWVESVPGHGATFYFSLPAEPPP